MGLFKGLQICLDLGCSLNFKKKTELRKKIVENQGIISYIVTKNCHIVVTSDPEKCDVSSKCRMAIKYGLPVLRLDYIWDSIDADKLLPYDSYIVGGKSKILDFKSGKISAFSHSEKPKKYNAKPAFNPRTVKIWTANDTNQPQFNEESHEVAKYVVFMGYSSSLKCQYTTILELHTPSLLSGVHNKSEVAMDDGSTENLLLYRVVLQSGCHKDLEAGKPCHMEIRYTTTAEQALAVFAMLHEDVERKGELTRCRHPVRGVGSHKLQKLMAEVVGVDNDSSDEVKELVDHVWREAMAEVSSVLGDIRKIKLEQVDKAEAILVKVRDALKASSSGKTINTLIEDFYSALPHVQEVPNVNDTKRWLASKQDMCQLIKDMMAASEMTNYETRAYIEAKYAALRCRITHLKESQKNDIVNLINSSLESAVQNLHILNVFEVWRWTADLDFRHDLDRKELLFHSSKVENFVGILSRGLLLPKIVVDDFGGQRSDAGMLGSGIYFASAASKSMRYSSPSKTKGSRLLLVNEVALGSCKDIIKHDTTLVAPPEGYDSTHGVSRKWDKSSEFENDEFVVYSVNQQRIRYLVEFTMQEDIVRPLKKIDTVDTSAICDSVENASLHDVAGIADPMLKVKPGLIGTGGREVELRCVHIRAKLVDMAAQVVVLQEYYNNSQQAIEAKYVFPLDDAAAVCGFEAFINGKHIVGKVKEKEVAHKEYQQAISEGHGAYLMDQDEETPDMFTVSVGNLPPRACVLIKITYVAELQIEDEKISFLLPAAVAPWKEESALKLSTQDKLESYKMSATRTTVQVAVEMPFEIRSLHCPTHKINVKQTTSKAYVEMVNNQKFGAGFQLLIGLAEIHVPRMWVERHSGDKEHQACMLIFYPEFESSEVADGEVTLVLDVSNSMKGTPLLEAKKVALLILQNLPPGWSFNVVRFGSDYEEVFPAPKRSIEANLQSAIQFVQNSTADRGNTDIMRPLKPLFLLPRADKQRNVFLISDGHINDAAIVLHCTKQNSRHTRLFSFGVSATCNNYTLKAVSRVSGGAFEYFNSKSKSKWEPKVKSQISKACQPGLTSVNVEWHQYNDNLPAPVQAPQQITALFNGSHQVIYGFVPDCTMATLTAEVDEQKVSTVVSTSELSITEGVLVHRLTAKAIIRDWNDGILSRDRTEHEVAKMDLKNYIIDLSKEYSVVTQFTSFIAVEKREENEKDLPKEGPRIEELVSQENVDFLNYMGWTHIPEDDSLAILSVFSELSQEVNEQILSNKMICQLNLVEEKYKKLQQQMGPCDADVLTCARTLTQAYGLTGDTNRAANLAQTAYEEALGNISSLTVESDYTKLADILADLKEKVVSFKGQEQTQMAPIPFPAFGNGKIYIRTPAGSELTISCNGLLTVRQLKRLIQAQDMPLVHRQKLVFNGKPLEDFVSLEDLSIGYGDRISLEISQPEQPMDNRSGVVGAMCAEISDSISYEYINVKPKGFREPEALSASATGWSLGSVPANSAGLRPLSSAELVPSSSVERVSSSSAETVPTGASYLPTSAAFLDNVVPGFASCVPSNFAALSTDLPALPPTSALSLRPRIFSFSYAAAKHAIKPDDFQSPETSLDFGAEEHFSHLTAMPLQNFAELDSVILGTPEFSTSFTPQKSARTWEGLSPKVNSGVTYPASGLGTPTPASLGAPTPSGLGTPTPASFGAPTPASFGAPTPGFGATPPASFEVPTPASFGAPPTPGFGATPPASFGAPPKPFFGAPPLSGFGAPSSSTFGAPASGFGAQQPSVFGASTSSILGAPAPDSGTPKSNLFRAQTSGFGVQPLSGFKTASSVSVTRSSSDFGAPGSSTFGASSASTGFRARAPVNPKISVETLLSSVPATSLLFGAPEPLGFEAIELSGFRESPPLDLRTPAPAPPVFAVQKASVAFGRPEPSASFKAPRKPFEASLEIVSQASSASVGGVFGAPAPREPFEASPEVVSQASSASVGGVFGAPAPRGPFEASPEVVSQASSASVGGLFGAPAPRGPFEASPEVVSQASSASVGGLFGAPAPRGPFEASPEVVSLASSASVGGLFGAPAPKGPFEASPEVVSQASSASVGGVFGAPAPRGPFEASPEVVSQASSASVGGVFGAPEPRGPFEGLFEAPLNLAPKSTLSTILYKSIGRRAIQPSSKRLPLGTPEALTPSATFGAPTILTSPEAPAPLDIQVQQVLEAAGSRSLAGAAGSRRHRLITPVTQHESFSEFRSRTSSCSSPLEMESTTSGSLFGKDSTTHSTSMRKQNLAGTFLNKSNSVSSWPKGPPPVQLDDLGRRYKQSPQMDEYTEGFRQNEQMDEYLVNQSESSREFNNLEPLRYQEDFMETSKITQKMEMRCRYAKLDIDDMILGDFMGNKLLESDRSSFDIYSRPVVVESRTRQAERLVSTLDENVTHGKMVADSEHCFSSRMQSQFLDTDKSDLSLMTSGDKCIRAREVQLTVDDLDILLDCQTEQGSWKLGDQLDQLLGISSRECQRILVANGLRSLGRTASEHIEDLIATILVLFSITEFLKPGLLPPEASAGTLSKAFDHLKEGFDDEAWKKFSLSPEKVQKLKEAVRKAYMFCCKTERIHPCVYSILELGRNWVNVATAFLQPCAA